MSFDYMEGKKELHNVTYSIFLKYINGWHEDAKIKESSNKTLVSTFNVINFLMYYNF